MPLSDICNNGNNQSYRWTKTTNSAQKEDFRYIYIVSTHFYLFLYVITTLHATVWVWRIIYIRSEGKWNNATNCTMTFTKKITVKTSIKMVGWGYTDHRVWFMAGQLNKGQSLYIKHIEILIFHNKICNPSIARIWISMLLPQILNIEDKLEKN